MVITDLKELIKFMQVIYKYPLETFYNEIKLPLYSEVLTAQLQDQRIMLWIKLDPKLPKIRVRKFEVIGTGWEIDTNPRDYISTVQTHDGLVFHVFEKL